MVYKKSAYVFKKFVDKNIERRKEAKLNKDKAKDTYYKLLNNSLYGQQLKNKHDNVIEFIDNKEKLNTFIKDNYVKDIISEKLNDSYTVFIGEKIKNYQDLTDRSIILGSYVLAYSRHLLNEITDIALGEDRYNNKIIYTTEMLIVF